MFQIQTFLDDLTIRSRRFASSRLSHGRLKRFAPLTQDLDGAVEIVLRLSPAEGHPRAGALLERLGISGHGLLKARCPVIPLAQGRKGSTEIALRHSPVEGHPRTGAVRLEFPILWLHPGLRQRCVAPDV